MEHENRLDLKTIKNEKKLKFVISSPDTKFSHTEKIGQGRKIKFIRKLNNVR
jgi:hypothetical protein